jgi:integral membrane protein (TIGR01906 family)
MTPIRVAAVALAAALPIFFTANAMRILLSETYVRAAYARLGGEEVLTARERRDLALLGLRAVDPLRGESVAILRKARLPDGSRAFDRREVRHMQDVRTWLRRLLAVELVVLTALVALGVADRRRLGATLRWGGLATLAVGAVALVAMALDFDDVLLGFHHLLFEGNTWHFADRATLIRVYPERFWNWTGIAIGGLVVAQALVGVAVGKAIVRGSRNGARGG